jgi:DNA helicase TIP49 (TBP-interacting protein)
MEPRPADRGPGRIIFLHRASSSGKSALAKAIQRELPDSFPDASGVGTDTMLIRRSSRRRAIHLRTVVSVISRVRAISVLLSRPSA